MNIHISNKRIVVSTGLLDNQFEMKDISYWMRYFKSLSNYRLDLESDIWGYNIFQ